MKHQVNKKARFSSCVFLSVVDAAIHPRKVHLAADVESETHAYPRKLRIVS